MSKGEQLELKHQDVTYIHNIAFLVPGGCKDFDINTFIRVLEAGSPVHPHESCSAAKKPDFPAIELLGSCALLGPQSVCTRDFRLASWQT